MGISSKFTRAYDPAQAKEDGHVPIHISPLQFAANGRASSVEAGAYTLLAPENEGSRSGDGTGLQDPYAYQNDGVTSHDYAPFATGGVIPSTTSLRSRGDGPDGVGVFVDDPNTGVASQAPLTPGALMCASADGGVDGAIVDPIPQPRTTVQITKWYDTGPTPGTNDQRQVVDINASDGTGVVGPGDGYFTQFGGRILKENSPGDFEGIEPTDPIPPGVWSALIFRSEDAGLRIYHGVTGALIPTSVVIAGTYVPVAPTQAGTRVHTFLGRRYAQSPSSPARLRERLTGDSTTQEYFCDFRLVDVRRITAYLNNRYPGLAQAVGYNP